MGMQLPNNLQEHCRRKTCYSQYASVHTYVDPVNIKMTLSSNHSLLSLLLSLLQIMSEKWISAFRKLHSLVIHELEAWLCLQHPHHAGIPERARLSTGGSVNLKVPHYLQGSQRQAQSCWINLKSWYTGKVNIAQQQKEVKSTTSAYLQSPEAVCNGSDFPWCLNTLGCLSSEWRQLAFSRQLCSLCYFSFSLSSVFPLCLFSTVWGLQWGAGPWSVFFSLTMLALLLSECCITPVVISSRCNFVGGQQPAVSVFSVLVALLILCFLAAVVPTTSRLSHHRDAPSSFQY